jgi:hypothetical protein
MAPGTSSDPLQNATQAAREQAGALWSDTKQTARSVVGEKQQAAASGLGDFATVLRKAAREMDGSGKSTVCQLAQSAADGLERFSGTLRERDMNALMRDVESFARRQPVAFIGAAVAVGFLAARFLKASAPEQTPAAPIDPNIPF